MSTETKPETDKNALLSHMAESTVETFLRFLDEEHHITDVNVTILLSTPTGSVLASNMKHGHVARAMLDTVLHQFFQSMREKGRDPHTFINELREQMESVMKERGH